MTRSPCAPSCVSAGTQGEPGTPPLAPGSEAGVGRLLQHLSAALGGPKVLEIAAIQVLEFPGFPRISLDFRGFA